MVQTATVFSDILFARRHRAPLTVTNTKVGRPEGREGKINKRELIRGLVLRCLPVLYFKLTMAWLKVGDILRPRQQIKLFCISTVVCGSTGRPPLPFAPPPPVIVRQFFKLTVLTDCQHACVSPCG